MSEIAKHWIDGEWVGSGTVPVRLICSAYRPRWLA